MSNLKGCIQGVLMAVLIIAMVSLGYYLFTSLRITFLDAIKPTIKTEVRYVSGPEFRVKVPVLKPVKIEVPDIKYVHTYRDTIWRDSIHYIDKPIDSLEVVRDWLTKRSYSQVLFDIDTLGKCTVNLEVQRNRLKSLSYIYKPSYKVVTNSLYPKITLFGGIGMYNIGPSIQIGGYYNNVGISYQNIDGKYQGINLHYKLGL